MLVVGTYIMAKEMTQSCEAGGQLERLQESPAVKVKVALTALRRSTTVDVDPPAPAVAIDQGLTLVHFSALQSEHFLVELYNWNQHTHPTIGAYVGLKGGTT